MNCEMVSSLDSVHVLRASSLQLHVCIYHFKVCFVISSGYGDGYLRNLPSVMRNATLITPVCNAQKMRRLVTKKIWKPVLKSDSLAIDLNINLLYSFLVLQLTCLNDLHAERNVKELCKKDVTTSSWMPLTRTYVTKNILNLTKRSRRHIR